MAKRIIFIFSFLFISFCAVAQKSFEYVDSSLLNGSQEKSIEKKNTYDKDYADDDTSYNPSEDILGDTIITQRTIDFSQDTMASWKSKKQYAYAKDLAALLKKSQEQNKEEYTPPTRRTSSFMDGLLSSGFLKIILWLLAIIFVGYILYQLFLSKGAFSRSAKNTPVGETITEDEVFLQQNFDQLIHQSCKLGDYRTATRYLFLKVLRQLSDKNIISFAIDKTNSKYVYEIPLDKRNDFAALVMNYEYVWYGNSAIDKEIFTGIETKFVNFSKRI